MTFFSLFTLTHILSTFAVEKHWLPDAEWSNPLNWDSGHVPNDNEIIEFPLEMRHAMGLPINTELIISKFKLPWNGIVALAKEGSVQVVLFKKKVV